MTSHRALKRLVRARMQRTGESYTTAHRHVTAHRVGNRGPGTGHRESALVRTMLARAGLDLTEATVCGLGGGIGFLYAVFEYDAVPYPLLTVVTQHHPTPWVDAVADHLGLELSAVRSAATDAAIRKLARSLDEGLAAWIVVARGVLPWHDDVSPLEQADPYPLVVTGLDGDRFVVLDREEHLLSRDRLAPAWAGHRKGRFAISTVRPGGATDLTAARRAATATTYRHLTGPVLGNSFDVNFGLSGMRRLRDDLADTTSRRGWRRRFGAEPAYAVGLERLADCLTWAYGSPGATRPAYAEFLMEAGLPDAAVLAREAGSRWAAIADAAARATEVEPGAMFADLAARVDEVVAVEERLADDLGRSVAG
ncbi:BtrH N-terminal domain-containing protein [Isoptericola variabilis]|uniref:Butirosin biosynthesis protein H N-terminal domain-containing protein n=1 Tax=Isoptericola variabilis (strain 225) TaxID=743718 RepID=F6FXD8_ISOV2|nr:BtrH N-terminal domain-containing protein [Isoptericola variabilis]AEG44666.1 hypothetical protein Isova_1929 [Isoptericola variabilis 225]TWH33476.1 uncharacterized protein DUF4872 [Isoptericola variabilis J7]